MVVETKKILDPKIKVLATCKCAPTFIGHAEAINLGARDVADEREAQHARAGRAGASSWSIVAKRAAT